MIAIALALLAASTGAVDDPTTYLASISLPLKQDERIDSFSISTWGVTVRAVCHIPNGWTLRAGRQASVQIAKNSGKDYQALDCQLV